MVVDVVIEDARWATQDLDALAERAVFAVLDHVEVDPAAWDVVVMGCDDARITALNTAFRAKATATNVLSWPSAERGAEEEGTAPDPPRGTGELGDLALAFETCLHEAEAGGKSLKAHALHLIVHGTLHLLGYDHVRDGDADLMESLEIAILERLGVANPYGEDAALGTLGDGKD